MAVKLGVAVDVVEHFDRALGMYPADYVAKLVAKMEREGVRFHWSEDVCGVEKTADGRKRSGDGESEEEAPAGDYYEDHTVTEDTFAKMTEKAADREERAGDGGEKKGE